MTTIATDATLLLGRIPPHLLGGEIPLDLNLAERGLAELAANLGLATTRTAAGIPNRAHHRHIRFGDHRQTR